MISTIFFIVILLQHFEIFTGKIITLTILKTTQLVIKLKFY